jgi:hypothetical protein
VSADNHARQLAWNVEDGNAAREFVSLLAEQRPHFWEVLRDLAIGKLPPVPAPVDPCPPMDDQEAANFELWIMPYGKYGGKTMGEIPVGYMCWFADGDEVVKAARRYVRSRRFRDRQDSEGPEEFEP